MILCIIEEKYSEGRAAAREKSKGEMHMPEEQEKYRKTGYAEHEASATEMPGEEIPLRPITRGERRNLWLKEYGEQDFALQMWVNLVEKQDLEIEMMLQMQGLLVFGVLVSALRYSQFYIDLNEELHRQSEPETADIL